MDMRTVIMSLSSQQKAMGTLIKRHGFYLLISPTGPVKVGNVWEGPVEGIDLSPVDELSSFVKPKNIIPRPTYSYPNIARSVVTYSYNGMIKKYSQTNVAVEFFKGLFARIARTLGFKASGSYSSEKVEAVYYNFINNTLDSVMRNSLTRSLSNFIIDRDVWKKGMRYFVVTEVYRSKDIQMLFVNGEDKDIKAAVEAAKLASVDFSYRRAQEGMELIFHRMETPIPFGVQLGELVYDYVQEKFSISPFVSKGAQGAKKGRIRTKPKKVTKRVLKIRPAKVGPQNNIIVKVSPKRGEARNKR